MNNAGTDCMQFPACQGLTVSKHWDRGFPRYYIADKGVGLHTLFKLFDFV